VARLLHSYLSDHKEIKIFPGLEIRSGDLDWTAFPILGGCNERDPTLFSPPYATEEGRAERNVSPDLLGFLADRQIPRKVFLSKWGSVLQHTYP
jgi:hypothetical protein